MKRLIAIFTSVVLILSLCTAVASAQELVTVKLNGVELNFDVPAQIINDRTLVPLRAIFEGLGATVDWEDATQTVTSVKGDTTVSLQIGSTAMYVNGVAKTLDVPAQLVDDRTLVPARAVAESFGAQVEWDDANDTVLITDKTIYNYGGLLQTALTIPDPTSVQAQLDMMASVRMNANETNTGVTADISMTADPVALMAKVSMADGHNSVDADVYALEEEGIPTLYMAAKYGYEGSSVQKSNPDSVWSVANYQLMTGRMYYSMSESIKVLGEEGNCVKYLVTITGENIKALINESKIDAILPSNTGLDIVLANIKATDTLDITMWIDKDLAQPVKTAWDLAPLMNKVFVSTGMDSGAVASQFSFEITVNSFNDVAPITYPQEPENDTEEEYVYSTLYTKDRDNMFSILETEGHKFEVLNVIMEPEHFFGDLYIDGNLFDENVVPNLYSDKEYVYYAINADGWNGIYKLSLDTLEKKELIKTDENHSIIDMHGKYLYADGDFTSDFRIYDLEADETIIIPGHFQDVIDGEILVYFLHDDETYSPSAMYKANLDGSNPQYVCNGRVYLIEEKYAYYVDYIEELGEDFYKMQVKRVNIETLETEDVTEVYEAGYVVFYYDEREIQFGIYGSDEGFVEKY